MELPPILDLLNTDGEIGQPTLRHCGKHLFVALTKRCHVLCLLILRGGPNEISDQLKELSLSAEAVLADSLDELERLLDTSGVSAEIDAYVLLPDIDAREAQVFNDRLPLEQSIFKDQLTDIGDRCALDKPLEEAAFARARELLFPKREWQRVELVKDEGRMQRHLQRAQLDDAQKSAAWGLGFETVAIAGGPGTGKSLVLAARAQWLAYALGKSKIILLTWNRTLAGALEDWLALLDVNDSHIEVLVLTEFLERHRITFSLADPDDADRRCSDLLRRKTQKPVYDAILIDEAQDLGGKLLQLVEQFILPNRGGLTMSLDSQQNIRSRPRIAAEQLRGPHKQYDLSKAYRSTPQIQGFAHTFGGVGAADTTCPFDQCEPVRLVWADSSESCNDLVAFEAKRLMEEVALRPGEIMVVVFSTSQMIELKRQFAELGIATGKPCRTNDSVQIASPEVAKGHEANCVFVVGWDQCKDLTSATEASRRFVAASRASDILYVVYSSQDVPASLLESDAAIKQLWPDDFRSESVV